LTVEALKALINKLIETKENEIQELKGLLQALEETPKEVVEQSDAQFLTRKDKLYARILKQDNKLIIMPIESLGIKVKDPAIIHFLQPKILDRMQKKHGIRYRLESKDGKTLRAIVIEGEGYDENRLLDACAWSLEKAANRQ